MMGHEASMRFEVVEFNDNVSIEGGGAFAINRTIAQLAGSTFELNYVSKGEGDALFIADDLNDEIDGSYVFCDPTAPVSFCYGFDNGSAIFEVPGDVNPNTNCQEVGLSDIFSEKCPNYKP